eukprot:CAMPEP_0179184280 /NCGR_PEP_ID=MMETSP0796-20121207/91356_1 /TAXON_ID=73915 /ORGANISM="Pyrodinium bahamense, Strain pbaha01" /LENGTH=253 /DNA_ID=CAMNT_0020888201 /DNA_START=23 /DNA_END=781 /DNA_ORIENTATION=+
MQLRLSGPVGALPVEKAKPFLIGSASARNSMQRAMQQLFTLLLLSTCALGARRGLRQALLAENEDTEHATAAERANGSTARGNVVTGMLAIKGEGFSQNLDASVGSLDSESIVGKDLSVRHIMQVGHDTMDIGEAVARLEGKLPYEVSSLVRLTTAKVRSASGSTSRGDLDEDSLQKARKILNSMIEGAWKDLDAVLIECKEFKERNRETHSQVSTDLARLGSQIADLERKKLKASEGIAAQDRLHQEVTEQL